MKIKLEDGAYTPTRAHAADAGLDLYAMNCAIVPARGSCCFDTGVHVEIPAGHVGFLKTRSSMNVNHGILVGDGTIDSGFTGTIITKLYNMTDKDYTVKRGDRIAQLVVLPIVTDNVEIVDSLAETERGESGYGSSGR